MAWTVLSEGKAFPLMRVSNTADPVSAEDYNQCPGKLALNANHISFPNDANDPAFFYLSVKDQAGHESRAFSRSSHVVSILTCMLFVGSKCFYKGYNRVLHCPPTCKSPH